MSEIGSLVDLGHFWVMWSKIHLPVKKFTLFITEVNQLKLIKSACSTKKIRKIFKKVNGLIMFFNNIEIVKKRRKLFLNHNFLELLKFSKVLAELNGFSIVIAALIFLNVNGNLR